MGGEPPEEEEPLCFQSREIRGGNETGRLVQFSASLKRRFRGKNASEGSRRVV